MKLLCIAAILQGSLYLFTTKLAIVIGIKAFYQIRKECRRCIGIQIAIGSRAIGLYKTYLEPVMLTQQLDLLFLDIFTK
ncbi:hypothetical protein ACET9H_20750 [Aeromonas media]|uniref:hypothetical protein n=1 Tax=Aeromonas media TaxID=651 RepID=UPI00126A49EC|nr:hypothetical protein [Aeromonas media]